MPYIARLAHISDLHFVEELTERGRRHWLKAFGTKSHDFGKLEALSAKFFELKTQGRNIDLLLVTGDVSTDGSIGSLNTALEFVEQRNIYRQTPPRRITAGLGMTLDHRIMVPGNHDRYAGGLIPLQQPSMNFETVFQTSTSYPYALGFMPSEGKWEPDPADSDPRPPVVLLFVFDSTLTQSGRADLWNRVARGRIEPGECNRLRELAWEIKQNREVRTLDGASIPVNYERAVRIALLHHHPVVPLPSSNEMMKCPKCFNPLRRVASDSAWFTCPQGHKFHSETVSGISESEGSVNNSRLMLMENAQLFIDACFDAQIDIVCFGHQHLEYSRIVARHIPVGSQSHITKEHKVHFFCSATASEYSHRNAGFYLIELQTGHFSVESFRWNGVDDWPGDSFESKVIIPYSYADDKLRRVTSR